MRVHVIGGGPAGLYLGILMKRRNPSHEIQIRERNRPGDTFGFGVVFSAATLGNFEEADPESLAEIRQNMMWWDDIDTWVHGEWVRSTGHGFCGLARVKLLEILSRRAQDLGCQIVSESEVEDPERWRDADLVVGSDGVNSRVRARYAASFKPQIEPRHCRFIWLGTDRKLPAFTFLFTETPFGLFQVHAYPFDEHTSTFIVECHETVWRAAGLDKKGETETLAWFEQLFAEHLKGHRLLSRAGGWRAFPNIRNERWYHENVVIVGDAAHTAHFSIGSGTKLAMEDAISLCEALHGPGTVAEQLVAYDTTRRPEVERLQKTAQTSLEWFEHSARYLSQDPLTFSFNLMTRSKRITYDELALRDPALVDQVKTQFAAKLGVPPVPPAFTPYRVRDLVLPNRIVVSPMCQYSCEDGFVNDWHLVHLGSRAVGGAGLIIAEATATSAEGRITPGCAGLYRPEHVAPWKRVVDFVHAHSSARIGIQIGHAGRKAACHLPWEGGKPLSPADAWQVVGPSPLPYDGLSQTPHALTVADLQRIRAEFVQSARWAVEAGFDWLELHYAHGYLLSTFLSPLTNHRTDAYGGSLENRLRFPLELLTAVREVWSGPLSVRLSTTDWAPGGTSEADLVQIARALQAAGADLIDCSAGGVVPEQKPNYGRMFQVPYSELIRHEAGVPTMAVGAISDVDQVNTLIAAGRADLCLLARAHLSDPYLSRHAAERYGVDVDWPSQYLAVKPGKKKGASA